MKCDMDCPYGNPYCCRGCFSSRRHLKDIYPDEWTDELGFDSANGCKIGDDRPQECKDYDCKDYVFYSTTTYKDGGWVTTGLHEIPKGS